MSIAQIIIKTDTDTALSCEEKVSEIQKEFNSLGLNIKYAHAIRQPISYVTIEAGKADSKTVIDVASRLEALYDS